MRTILLASVVVSPVLAGFDTWSPPGPYDGTVGPIIHVSKVNEKTLTETATPVRAPCPMLNTLANHGFLPHHGKDITRQVTEDALFDALNINKTLGSFLFDFAMTTNPAANATTFSLNDLGNHNILEHDASLSRSDAYFGNALVFNQSVFDETKKYWTDDWVTIKMAAKARLARIKTSNATNPTYQLSPLGDAFTYGESAAYVVVFGDKSKGRVKRSWVKWLFEHEEFPQHLGWRRPSELFQAVDLDRYMEEIKNYTTVLEGPAPGGHRQKRRDSHFGW